MFGKIILFSFFLLFFPLHQAKAGFFGEIVIRADRVILETNDAGEEISLSFQEYEQYFGNSPFLHPVSFYDFKKSFQDIFAHLTPVLEQAYDVFVLVNAQRKHRHSWDYVPPQFMRVLRKTRPNQKVFVRNETGVIINIHPEVLGRDGKGAFKGLQGLIPISSGAGHLPPDEKGQSFVNTPAGIYRINIDKSIERRFQEDIHIYHGLYFDLIYPSGLESGLAIHGTNKSNYPFLGDRQSSHGCVRTTVDTAYILYEKLMSEEFMDKNLPDMDQRKRLKSELRDDQGRIVHRPGSSALFIIFYGYENESVAI